MNFLVQKHFQDLNYVVMTNLHLPQLIFFFFFYLLKQRNFSGTATFSRFTNWYQKQMQNHMVMKTFELTLIPALLHFSTASGTAALGGSIIAISPTNVRLSNGKLTLSVSNWNPGGKLLMGKYSWQKPSNRIFTFIRCQNCRRFFH